MSTHTQKHHFDYTINEWSQPFFQNYLETIFKDEDDMVIYDIGANVGGVSYLILQKYIHKVKKIYCFEPDNENMEFLKEKLKDYILIGKVICIQKGIYYGKTKAKVFGLGHCELNEIHKNVGGYTIDEIAEKVVQKRNNNGENVFCGQIDNKEFDLIELESLDIEKPDFVKMDIEGSEKNVLINSKRIKNTKYMILEWNQSESLDIFLKEYMPNFKIIDSSCDYLLKKI